MGGAFPKRGSSMSKKRLLLIINPCSGKKKATKQLADIIAVFNRADYTVITHITSHGGDCQATALEYASVVDLIVCCGGDGTFNEMISGVVKSGVDVPVGYIPAGSTNDFAATLQISTDMVQAAKDIVEGEPFRFDVGQFADRYFAYIASFGLFTKASYDTPQEWKNAIGHAAYVLSGIQELSQLKAHKLRFEIADGEIIEGEFLFGAISNSTSVGGMISLSKEKVDLTDGKLELILIRMPKDLKELADCIVAIQKKTYDSKLITFLNASQIKVFAPMNLTWTLDGERGPSEQEIDVKCLGKAIQIIVKAKK